MPRWGRATQLDVIDNSTAAVVVRNLTAEEVIASYTVSLTVEDVLAGVAGFSYVDSDGYRVTAHMQIAGT
jgi:hypothetical protein